jgi:hypothetical protein
MNLGVALAEGIGELGLELPAVAQGRLVEYLHCWKNGTACTA